MNGSGHSMETIKMGIHIGNALKYVTDNYPTLTKVILELIQNSLDSDSSEIMVIIDYKKKLLCVRDNGSGISPSKFGEAISSVCSSLKHDKDKLGQFGIGLLSPLGKCNGFLITSAEKSVHHVYNRWIFNSKRILGSPELPEIPMVPMPNMFYSTSGSKARGREAVSWRTEVVLENFSNDRSINAVSLTELKNLILGQFSESMRRLNTEVTVLIKRAESASKETTSFKAASFNGDKLDRIAYGDSKSGETTFNIYLSPKVKNGRKGELLVGVEGNDFRIPMSVFVKSVPELDSEIVNVLTSGTFEGAILSSSCELHPNRKEFFDNEARLNFLIHLDSWVKNHGYKYMADIKDGEKDVWLQAVGSLAINQLEGRIKNQMPHLLPIIKSFRFGTVGTGHYGFNNAGPEQAFSSSKKELGGRQKRNGNNTATHSPNIDRKPELHNEHTPFKVSGEGQKRRLVKGHSTGLQFVFEEMPGNDHHWEFDSNTGVLSFNMRSDVWAKMEGSERNLILYQQYVAIKALELQLEPPTVRSFVYEFLQRELKSAASFITTTSAIHPRKAKSEVGKKIK